MSALDDWTRIPYPARRRILDALSNPVVTSVVAVVLDPPNPCNELNGSEMTHDEEHDLATAIAVLEEVTHA